MGSLYDDSFWNDKTSLRFLCKGILIPLGKYAHCLFKQKRSNFHLYLGQKNSSRMRWAFPYHLTAKRDIHSPSQLCVPDANSGTEAGRKPRFQPCCVFLSLSLIKGPQIIGHLNQNSILKMEHFLQPAKSCVLRKRTYSYNPTPGCWERLHCWA